MSGFSRASSKGLWTPVLTSAVPGDLAVTYARQLGEWYLDNWWVELVFSVQTSAFTFTTATGVLRLTGSPFTAKTLANMRWHGPLGSWQTISRANYSQVMPRIDSGANVLEFNFMGQGQASVGVSIAVDVLTATTMSLNGSIRFPLN